MDQDATWYRSRPRPRRHCVRWGPSSLPKQKGHSSSPLFGPCLLWLNGRPSQQLLSSCHNYYNITVPFTMRTLVSQFRLSFFFSCFGRESFMIMTRVFLQTQCPSCHRANTDKALMETRSEAPIPTSGLASSFLHQPPDFRRQYTSIIITIITYYFS